MTSRTERHPRIDHRRASLAAGIAGTIVAVELGLVGSLARAIDCGSNGSTSTTVNSALTGDVSGDDVAFHITGSGFESIDTEVVVIGQTAYIRQSGGAWTTAPRSAIGSMIDVLIQVVRPVDDPSDLSYVGVETVDGRELHPLTASGTIAYRPAAGGTGNLDAFDIWVEEDGTPVLAKATLSATDPRGSQFSGTTEVRFSNFGGSIDIAAPSVAP